MIERDALRLLRGLLKAHGETRDLVGLDTLVLSAGDVELQFDFVDKTLRCRAQIHQFRRTPDPAILQALSPPTIGRFVLDDGRLVLEHCYGSSVALTRFVQEMESFLEESRGWISGRLVAELG